MSSASQSRIVTIADWVERAIGAVCKVVIVVTTVILLTALATNVVVRYVLEGGGIPWVFEFTEQLFPWMIAAGIVLAVQHGAHIAVDLLLGALSPNAARVLAVSIHLLVAVSYTILLSAVLTVADIVAIERSPVLQVSRSWGYYALAFATAGTALGNLIIALRVAMLGIDTLPKGSPEESPV